MTRRPAALAALSLLAACAAAPSADPPDAALPPSATSCDASGTQHWIGKTATAAMLETARRESGAAARRTVTPGTLVTMDYRPDRLTILLDAAGTVTALRCG